ncbi:hypothetical protein [Sphingobacterium sp. E70]|nr:hypothetical protein [Sphingobacterium sp. E70]
MSDQEKSSMFVGPKPEMKITPEERQKLSTIGKQQTIMVCTSSVL